VTHIGTKYDYAKAHGYAQRTAQKRLTAMHKQGEVWVSGWAKQLHQWVPIYSTGSGTDVPKPAPVPGAERSSWPWPSSTSLSTPNPVSRVRCSPH